MRTLRKTNKSTIANLKVNKTIGKLPSSFRVRSLKDDDYYQRIRLSKEAVVYVEMEIRIALNKEVIKPEQIFLAKAGLISTGIEHARKYGAKKRITRGNLVKGWHLQGFYQCIPGECFSRTIFTRLNDFEIKNPSFKDLQDL